VTGGPTAGRHNGEDVTVATGGQRAVGGIGEGGVARGARRTVSEKRRRDFEGAIEECHEVDETGVAPNRGVLFHCNDETNDW
jgi:hypothetical protein